MTEKYVLTMDSETARMVSRACELYARIVCGQYEEVSFETAMAWPEKFKSDHYCEMRDQAEAALQAAKLAMFPELSRHSSYGVSHNRKADTAWNVYQVVRHAMAWHEHPEGGNTVNFQKPMAFSGAPMPEIRIVEE